MGCNVSKRRGRWKYCLHTSMYRCKVSLYSLLHLTQTKSFTLLQKAESCRVMVPDTAADEQVPQLMRVTNVIKLAWPNGLWKLVAVDDHTQDVACDRFQNW